MKKKKKGESYFPLKLLSYTAIEHIFIIFISDLRTAFDLLDRNQDGRVTSNELQFMLKNLGIDVRDELIDDLIKEASHSGNSKQTIFAFVWRLNDFVLKIKNR